MKIRDYFNLGCKLFGVYFFYLSIPLFIQAVSSFFPIDGLSIDFEKYMFFAKLVSRLLPFIYVFIGYQLIKNGDKVFSFAYSQITEPESISSTDKFRLFLKMLGIFLIANNLIALIKSVTNYLAYSKAPSVLTFINEQRFSSSNFLPSLVAILLGIYLLRDGNFIINLGFSKNGNSIEE